MLSELEEVIVYKLIPDNREKIKLMWWNRLQVGSRSGRERGIPVQLTETIPIIHGSSAKMFEMLTSGMSAHGGRLGSNSPRSVSSDHTSRRREDMVEIRFALQEK